METKVRELREADDQRARAAYQRLYENALPGGGGISAERIEVATFNCSEAFEEFQQVGLGLETVVIFRDESGEGHTGKVLMNLPWQLLPEHGHVDTLVLKKEAPLADGFVKLSGLINGFEGVRKYNSDASPACDSGGHPVYLYRDEDYQIVQSLDGRTDYPGDRAEDVVAVFPGKSETFKAIYGDGVLFADAAQVLYTPPGVDPNVIPDGFLPRIGKIREEQAITTRRMIYMTQGMNVLLPKNTAHAFLGGAEGCVYLEFSTPSMDEADRFTDPRVIR
jgi:hypothetical protein